MWVRCWLLAAAIIGLGNFPEVSANEAVPSSAAPSVQDLAARVKPAVAVITFAGRDGSQQGLGSGFVVDASGLIATNLHVIGEARPITVRLHDGRTFDVKSVHASDRHNDLAVIKIEAADLPTLPLGNSDELQDGEALVAIGNPLGLEHSVVTGVLSGRRDVEERPMLQVAMPIERGNSGCPLLDLQGRVHGLITLKSLRSENLGFAAPVNELKALLENPNPIPIDQWLTIGVLSPSEWTPHCCRTLATAGGTHSCGRNGDWFWQPQPVSVDHSGSRTPL